jgi:hypothetical protein
MARYVGEKPSQAMKIRLFNIGQVDNGALISASSNIKWIEGTG